MSAAGASILIVEDETIVTMDLEDSLESLGYGVAGVCHRGEDAVLQAAELQPDLILMDIQLAGELNGIDAALQIRRQQEVPIVFLTANTDESTLQQAKQARPNGFLMKPFENRDLQVVVDLALYQYQMEAQNREVEAWLHRVVNNLEDGVIASDAGSRIRVINDVARELTGWTGDSAIGSRLDEVLKFVAAAKTSQASPGTSRKVMSSSGEVRAVCLQVIPMAEAGKVGVGELRLLRSVSAASGGDEERDELLRRLTWSNQEKDRLSLELATRTHALLQADRGAASELRTSLASLRGPVEAAQERLVLRMQDSADPPDTESRRCLDEAIAVLKLVGRLQSDYSIPRPVDETE